MTKRKVGRSAVDGRFVTEKEVKKNPTTTVTEIINYPKPNKKKP